MTAAVLRYTPEDVWPELRADARVLLAALDDLAGAAARGLPALVAAFEDLRLRALPFGACIHRGPGGRRGRGPAGPGRFPAPEALRDQAARQVRLRRLGPSCPDSHYRAFLAIKYRDTANGHYWALLDGVHALYVEMD